ncbi:MAG TPA: ABC transporter permease [Gemmatimonadaceae bacterium]|nr:ABC transporter permease [Gemmatimonadaceae bacterium]
MDTLIQDLRFAARTFRRNPGFTVAALLTLALGIGGTTAVFTVVNAVLLRPLPFADGDRLVRVVQTLESPDGSTREVSVSALNFSAMRERSRLITGAVAHRFRSFIAGAAGDGEPERVVGIRVSERWMTTLGVQAALGRGFSPEEEQAGEASRVVLVSDGLWRRRLAGDRNAIGTELELDGEMHTVIGVLPRGFHFPYEADLWLPMRLDPTAGTPRDLNVAARMASGVTLDRLQRELAEIGRQLALEHPINQEMVGLTARTMRTELVGDFRTVILVLFAAVGFLLLIACVNVANLLLARAAARRAEVGIRAALGASRSRQIRQLLTESVLLSAAGGVAGIALTLLGTEWLGVLIPDNMRTVLPAVAIDARLLSFAAFVSVLTAVLFGLVPALKGSRADLHEVLKDSGRSSGGAGKHGLLRGLVVAELALAVVLLTGGGLMLRDLRHLLGIDMGIATEGLVTMNIAFPESRYADASARMSFVREVEERVRAVPGISAAGVTTIIPFGSGNTLASIAIEDRPATRDVQPSVNHRLVSPGFFAATGMPLMRGRAFNEGDREGALPVVIVNQAMAQRYWPGEDPIGKRVRQGGTQEDRPWLTVVGVVGNVAEDEIPETWYLPYAQGSRGTPVSWSTLRVVLVVRGTPGAVTQLDGVRRAVWEIDPALPIFDVATIDRLYDDELSQQRLGTLLFGIFAALGLLMAALGIYGVMAYATTQRRREIGIRMALGADARRILRTVLGDAVVLVVVGLGVGLVSALAVTRFMSGLLSEVSPRDPLTFAVVAALLCVVAVAASYIPAWRATRVEPVQALKQE